MTIDTCVGRFVPDLDAHDMQCIHFARLFRGHKPIGRWMPNTSHRPAEHNALRAIRHPMQRRHARLAMVVVRFVRAPLRARASAATRAKLVVEGGIDRVGVHILLEEDF